MSHGNELSKIIDKTLADIDAGRNAKTNRRFKSAASPPPLAALAPN